MDFSDKKIVRLFALFIEDRLQAIGQTCEWLAHKAGYTPRHVNNYLNPDRAGSPQKINKKFYADILGALGSSNEKFKAYTQTINDKSTRASVGDVSITDSTLTNSPVAATGNITYNLKE